jgi:hypothetical protein
MALFFVKRSKEHFDYLTESSNDKFLKTVFNFCLIITEKLEKTFEFQ